MATTATTETLPQTAEQRLIDMLAQADIRIKPAYRPGEVQRIIGCSERTFWRLCAEYEPEQDSPGQPTKPGTLDSYLLRGERRVRYSELVMFLHRNNTWRRKNAIDPNQLDLFAS